MARQQGINTQFAGVFESTYGTAPGSGYFKIPLMSHDLGAERPLEEDDSLSGRRELAPTPGAVEAGGDVVVPLEAESIGFWLTALCGSPATTGTGPYTHVFEMGAAASLPSMALETWMSAVPHAGMVKGALANTLAIEASPTGKLQATIGVIAQDEAKATSSGAGTPSEFTAYNRLLATSAALQRNGSALTSKGETTSVNFDNTIDALRALDGTGTISDGVPERSVVTGRVQLRFADQTMLNQAVDHTSSTLQLGFASGDGSETLTILMHEVYLPRPKIPVAGPGGIQADFDFRAVKDPSNGKQATITLVNNTASY